VIPFFQAATISLSLKSLDHSKPSAQARTRSSSRESVPPPRDCSQNLPSFCFFPFSLPIVKLSAAFRCFSGAVHVKSRLSPGVLSSPVRWRDLMVIGFLFFSFPHADLVLFHPEQNLPPLLPPLCHLKQERMANFFSRFLISLRNEQCFFFFPLCKRLEWPFPSNSHSRLQVTPPLAIDHFSPVWLERSDRPSFYVGSFFFFRILPLHPARCLAWPPDDCGLPFFLTRSSPFYLLRSATPGFRLPIIVFLFVE